MDDQNAIYGLKGSFIARQEAKLATEKLKNRYSNTN